MLDSKGLYTYNNPLGSQAVPGSMSAAMNVNCDDVGITTTRRGFDFYSAQELTITDGYVTKLFAYAANLYVSYDAGRFAYDNGSGTWTRYPASPALPTGLVLPPSGGAIHQMLAGGNSYFTTSNGILKLSGVNGNPPIPAGAPQGLDTVVTVSSVTSTGFIAPQSQCAYQIVWGYVDDSNLQILGAPSQPAYAINNQGSSSSDAANATIVFSIPYGCVATNAVVPWFYQIYRTPNTGSLTVPPGNNYQLVFQGTPTSGDYTNLYVSYADTNLDANLGADLYTDNGQPGVGAPYNQPPLAYEAAYFNSMAFYANLATAQTMGVTLFSVGSPSGLQSGDTVTFKDIATSTIIQITAGASNDASTGTFQLVTGGSPAANIAATAQNLVTVANQITLTTNNLFYLQYVSGFSGLPGQIQITAQNLSQGQFSMSATRGFSFPNSYGIVGTSFKSTNTISPNLLAISNVGMPESVPPFQLEPVGSPNYSITRLLPVRQGMIICKAGEGVWLATGSTPSTISIQPLDTTAFIKGSETLATLNNAGYFFTTQGVMLANESGCEIMSRNIQGDILELASYEYTHFNSLAFAVGYQSDNAYILFCQAAPTDTYSTIQYRYNWITQAWTTWNIPCTAAIVNPANDRLYLATPQGYILEERKTFTNTDYADETQAITISSVGTGTLTLASSVNVGIGDQIAQTVSGTLYTAYVLTNNTTTGVIGVTSTTGFTAAAASDIVAIESSVTFMPTSCGYPAFVKKFTTWNFEFGPVPFNSCVASFSTDFFKGSESVTLIPNASGAWGTFPWGALPWGVTSQSLQPISTYATKNTSVGHWAAMTLSIQQAYTGFSLSGYTIFFEFLGERSR